MKQRASDHRSSGRYDYRGRLGTGAFDDQKIPETIYHGRAAARSLSDAAEEVRTFANKLQAPVADTLMGKGAFDGTHEQYTGMVGMHGTKTSNFGITETCWWLSVSDSVTV